MTLLSEICGLKGENLCSAVLAHLLLSSPEVRSLMIRLISDRAPQGPIYVSNQFAVFREHWTDVEDPSDGESSRRGRLDLVIETDDAVIALESKFNAPFQDGQPAGYLELLEERSKQLSNLRQRAFTHVLVVLGPARRKAEVTARFQEQQLEVGRFLAWESLLDELQRLQPGSPVDAFLIRELKEYATSQIGSISDLGRILPHLRNTWAPRGSSVQRDFMNGFVWSLLDDRVKNNGAYRCSHGSGHYGFYLRPCRQYERDNLWIGFVERPHPPQRAALAICTYAIGDGLPEGPQLQRIEQPGWSDWGWSSYELQFEASPEWSDIARWECALQPVNELIQKSAERA